MNRAFVIFGRVAFWLGWPLWQIIFSVRSRARVLVICKGDVLLEKSYLGSGRWGLPGGGRKSTEDSRTAAVRELREETGVELEAKQLESLGSWQTSFFGLRYQAEYFAVRFSERPTLRSQPLEIAELAWLPLKNLTPQTIHPSVQEALERYSRGIIHTAV